jgi:hypothetical protein
MEGLRELRPKGVTVTKPGPAWARIGPPMYFPAGTTVADATHILYKTMEKMRDDFRRERRPFTPLKELPIEKVHAVD